ncbi:MAG: hypothetical protein CL807_09670 [Citromicrobium sp.]|nr:hypothetical protein [Citromicrobium sp.]MAO96190.1 hypothetical protein [Citromicrobium sp.]MBD77129.1 hypothetical protein [Citromicrobium sp.]MBT47911.1 hypothetical protein [Citromicrobium sp.]|tara:strand:+ start:6108 stop:6290 length:183 start_codon:yes stop_codon:yes gene_type:complete
MERHQIYMFFGYMIFIYLVLARVSLADLAKSYCFGKIAKIGLYGMINLVSQQLVLEGEWR